MFKPTYWIADTNAAKLMNNDPIGFIMAIQKDARKEILEHNKRLRRENDMLITQMQDLKNELDATLSKP